MNARLTSAQSMNGDHHYGGIPSSRDDISKQVTAINQNDLLLHHMLTYYTLNPINQFRNKQVVISVL